MTSGLAALPAAVPNELRDESLLSSVPAAGRGFKVCPALHPLQKQTVKTAAVFLKTILRIRILLNPETVWVAQRFPSACDWRDKNKD
jgi:hypothetical protein